MQRLCQWHPTLWLAGFVGAALLFAFSLVYAEDPNGYCCVPPYGITPTQPTNANTDCYCPVNNGTCSDSSGTACSGAAEQATAKGYCATDQYHSCTADTGQQNASVQDGYWQCSTATHCTQTPSDNCDCVFILYSPQPTGYPKNVMTDTCSGDGCS